MMYFANLFGFVVCFVVLMDSKCSAARRDRQGESGEYVIRTRTPNTKCEDTLDANTCQAVKVRRRCDLPIYKQQCKKTCEACAGQSSAVSIPKIEETTSECRDIGTPEFCLSLKPTCERQRFGGHKRVRFALKYCKRTCGVCTPEATTQTKAKNTCVDRPICKKLTTFYKITTCSTLPRQLKKRAMKKCPRLCGLCGSGGAVERKVPEVAEAKRRVVDFFEGPQTVITPNERQREPRQPQPAFENRESDKEPRRGVFYIYTKYLSLRKK